MSSAQNLPKSHEIMTRAKIKSQQFNLLSHLDTPMHLSFKSFGGKSIVITKKYNTYFYICPYIHLYLRSLFLHVALCIFRWLVSLHFNLFFHIFWGQASIVIINSLLLFICECLNFSFIFRGDFFKIIEFLVAFIFPDSTFYISFH